MCRCSPLLLVCIVKELSFHHETYSGLTPFPLPASHRCDLLMFEKNEWKKWQCNPRRWRQLFPCSRLWLCWWKAWWEKKAKWNRTFSGGREEKMCWCTPPTNSCVNTLDLPSLFGSPANPCPYVALNAKKIFEKRMKFEKSTATNTNTTLFYTQFSILFRGFHRRPRGVCLSVVGDEAGSCKNSLDKKTSRPQKADKSLTGRKRILISLRPKVKNFRKFSEQDDKSSRSFIVFGFSVETHIWI